MVHLVIKNFGCISRLCCQIECRALVPFIYTRPKPVDHGYVFSMAVGTVGEWLKLVPFFVRGRTVDSVDSVNTLK